MGIRPWQNLSTGVHGYVIGMCNLEECFLKKILQKVTQRPTQVIFIPYKQVSGRNGDHEWLRKPMFSYSVNYSEIFRKVMQRTENVALISEVYHFSCLWIELFKTEVHNVLLLITSVVINCFSVLEKSVIHWLIGASLNVSPGAITLKVSTGVIFYYGSTVKNSPWRRKARL